MNQQDFTKGLRAVLRLPCFETREIDGITATFVSPNELHGEVRTHAGKWIFALEHVGDQWLLVTMDMPVSLVGDSENGKIKPS